MLTDSVNDMRNQLQAVASPPAGGSGSVQSYSALEKQDRSQPKQPLFVGHTRSQYSLDVAKTSLVQMGLSSSDALQNSSTTSALPSPRALSPEPDGPDSLDGVHKPQDDPLLSILPVEITRLIDVWREEVETIYPFFERGDLAIDIDGILRNLASPEKHLEPRDNGSDSGRTKDLRILKTVTAIGITIEAQGKNELGQRLIDSIEYTGSRITRSPGVDLRDLQWLAILSNYYFHCDEDLMAWRTIGSAVRMALEMGLHLKQSLMANYTSPSERALATRTFWCVYALDRRWSFGTGLPFALNDKDLDPELPEPGEDLQYLRCLIGYSRLGSRVWEALPSVGSSAAAVPSETVEYLDFLTHKWSSSIPADLQFLHPRLGFNRRPAPRTLRRLQTFLYLRGNHMRILIHRHHVLSFSLVNADLRSARLVVDVAKDTIQVLVDLANTSDIYARQQPAFNYFLLGALAIIFLAVCNAPELFSSSCRESFSSAVALVRGFSRQSHASKRLWRSIRGLIPAVRALGLDVNQDCSQNVTNHVDHVLDCERSVYLAATNNEAASSMPQGTLHTKEQAPLDLSMAMPDGGIASIGSVPDVYQISDDLMDLFDAFEQSKVGPIGGTMEPVDFSQPDVSAAFPTEVSRRFLDLI
ncbi:hypothetical protein TruAng_001692 [Truncatella angustata]|nr:hypothetical protein TruAng_001692 [Truncatella angustata]